ncbi:isochorismate synthase [Flavobacterium aquariorum]|uniref:isochorismate synthase n=1 Tax=Flavobacterium aquariorum TaxID=2217670 RepID=A0A2W7TXF7_9FLAO|nr:isochorismate synthase [Flavobacterium aquariorum]PZX94076.1 isochorismate synthase [Flavobacterium aquariorum]
MNDFFEKMIQQQQQSLPFVLYCKPNSDAIMGMFQQNDNLYDVVDFTEKGFVFSSFDGHKNYIIPEEYSEIKHFVFSKKEVSENENEFASPNEIVKTNFERLVAKGIVAIKENEFQKVVLSRKETIDLVDFDLVTTFENLVQLYPATFVYCFFHPKIGIWMGATPEQLLKVEDNIFKTMALAGTQKNTGYELVVWADKEKQEQQFVTDYIVSELNKVSKSILVSEPYSIKAGSIWHIKTDISGQLNSAENLKEVVGLLHPTPAVCGLPKLESKQFILENENYDRTFYTGYLGELNSSSTSDKASSDLFVNLRCMEIEMDLDLKMTKANLFMGCGITKDSIPEKEWEESINKSMTMKRGL